MDFAERTPATRRPAQRKNERISEGGSAAGMLRLQRLAGNAAVTHALQTGFAPVQREEDELEEEELDVEEEMTLADEEEQLEEEEAEATA